MAVLARIAAFDKNTLDQGGSIMSGINSEALRKRRREFQEESGRAFDQMLGSDGQNGLVTFAEREDRACELGDGLTRRLLEEHLGADGTAEPCGDVDCPICGRPVPCDPKNKAEKENRKVATRRGTIQYERAARRCNSCRRIFFPPG
jgi:hypothetical protein